jgi:superfamily I DNA and/or RNA helicase
MWMVNSVKLMRGLEGPFVFLDRTTKCKKDSATMSYYNTAEADLVANLAAEVAAKAGIQHLLITAPYKAQVSTSPL